MFHRLYLLMVIGLVSVFTESALAADGPTVGVEPIIGYERAQTLLPTPHSVSRMVYGARVTAGYSILSAEGEYTRGTVDETFVSMSQKSTADKLKIGLRSSYRYGSLLSFHLRGGVQAKQELVEQTTGGVTTVTRQSIVYHPYAGTGFRVSLSEKISGSVDVVAVFPQISDMAQNEYLVTAGFLIRYP